MIFCKFVIQHIKLSVFCLLHSQRFTNVNFPPSNLEILKVTTPVVEWIILLSLKSY